MLFDDGFDFNAYFNAMNQMETNNDNSLTNLEKGFKRGNMFENIYKPYKNYQPSTIRPKTEKDALMLKIYETEFAMIDLSLYLDLHKEDTKIYDTFRNYVNDFEKYKNMYEKQYGPLDLTFIETNTYEWSKNPWPWDKDGGNKYV